MISLLPQSMTACICASNGAPCKLCCDRLCFEEQGKHVKLIPRRAESAIALALDQCVFRDDKLKCDGLFVLSQPNKSYVLLVELKGIDIPHAYEQIAYVLNIRPEYREILEHVRANNAGRLVQKSFIVSNGVLGAKDKQKLENTWNIRPVLIAGQKPADKAPDLRDQRYLGG
jgi:hypothetical protein